MGTDNSVIRGTLDMLVLKVLSLGPLHGWGISELIQARSEDALQVGQGALYASLYRLDRDGWLRSSWGETENGRRARYYALTRAGERRLEEETEHWRKLAAGVTRIMALNP
jgi:transcriptional regulator